MGVIDVDNDSTDISYSNRDSKIVILETHIKEEH